MTVASIHASMIILIAVIVAAPLVAAAAVAVGMSRTSLRTPAAAGLALSLVVSLGITWLWHASDGAAFEYGERLGGGSLIHVDGITSVLLPSVAVVELAIILVAPKRFLDAKATVRSLFVPPPPRSRFSRPRIRWPSWPSGSRQRFQPGCRRGERLEVVRRRGCLPPRCSLRSSASPSARP